MPRIYVATEQCELSTTSDLQRALKGHAQSALRYHHLRLPSASARSPISRCQASMRVSSIEEYGAVSCRHMLSQVQAEVRAGCSRLDPRSAPGRPSSSTHTSGHPKAPVRSHQEPEVPIEFARLGCAPLPESGRMSALAGVQAPLGSHGLPSRRCSSERSVWRVACGRRGRSRSVPAVDRGRIRNAPRAVSQEACL